jgi:hypothetical protein
MVSGNATGTTCRAVPFWSLVLIGERGHVPILTPPRGRAFGC